MQDRDQILDWLRNSSSDEWNGSALNRAADEIEGLVSELRAACGYMRNAAIDLETGAPKRTALATINGGLKRFEAFLGPAKD